MPTFAAQTPPDTSKIRAARQRALLAGRIARDGESVTITRRNDTQGQAPYTQSVPCLVNQLAVLPKDIVLEGGENVATAEPTIFTFEGGRDINASTDKIIWQGANRRMAHIRRHTVQGQVTGIYVLALRE